MTVPIPQEVFEKVVLPKFRNIPYQLQQSQVPVVIPPELDVVLVKQLHRDLYRLVFPRVLWMQIDRKTTVVDRLYLETRRFIYKAPIEMPMYIQVKPSSQLLTKFGIDEERELLAGFSIPILEEMGLGANEVTIGDKIVYDGTEYEIMTVNRYSYVFNYNVPLDLIATLQRFRIGE